MIKTILFLTALALVQARPSDDAEPISGRRYEFHEDCPPAEIHFLLPHEYDCTKFYYCEYGLKWIEPRDCAPGTEFNAAIQVCVHPISSGCTLPGFNTTPGGDGTTVAGTTWPASTAATNAPSTTSVPNPTTQPPSTVGPTTVATQPPSTMGPTTVATTTPDSGDDCETLDNGCPADFTVHQLLPHEEYCHKFYYCDKGELVLRYCAPGTYFNPKLQVCDWPQNVDCVNDGSYEYPTTPAPTNPPPSPPGDGDNDIGDTLDNGCPADFDVHHLLPHETECNKFYYCVFGEKVERSCAPGTYFNYEIQVCDWPANVNCASSGSTPGSSDEPSSSEELPTTAGPEDPVDPQDPQVPEDPQDPEDSNEWVPLPNGCPADFDVHHLLPHETDCDKFYYCVNGQLIERGCAPGTHFNPILQVCDWPANVNCASSGSTPGGSSDEPSSSEELPTTAGPEDPVDPQDPQDPEDSNEWVPLPNGCPADFDVHHLLPHETDCDKFYYCVNGQLIERGCAPGTHFNPILQVCDWPANVNCASSGSTPGSSDEPSSSEELPTTAGPEDPVDPEDSNEWVPLPNGCPADFDVHHLLPHETDCDKFYYCVDGQLIERGCAPGTHFSPSLQVCDWPQYAGCEHWDGGCSGPGDDNGGCDGTSPAPDGNDGTTAGDNDGTTAGDNDGTTAGDNDGTTAGDNDGTTAGDNDGTTADDNDGTTVSDCEACQPITPADICKSGCNVLPFVHDNDCDKYWICNGEQPLLVTCSEGLHFNRNTYSCDFICNAGCQRENVQITSLSEGVKLFLPWGSITSEMMELLDAQLNADL